MPADGGLRPARLRRRRATAGTVANHGALGVDMPARPAGVGPEAVAGVVVGC